MSEDLSVLMTEPPGGINHGRVATEEGRVDLDGQTTEFLNDGGWIIVSDEGGRQIDAGGLTTHRGIIHPDEYVDPEVLRAHVERRFGFTYDEVASVYRQGPLSDDQRQLRDKIDARLLALSRSGGNLTALAEAFGWSHNVAERALARARQAESL